MGTENEWGEFGREASVTSLADLQGDLLCLSGCSKAFFLPPINASPERWSKKQPGRFQTPSASVRCLPQKPSVFPVTKEEKHQMWLHDEGKSRGRERSAGRLQELHLENGRHPQTPQPAQIGFLQEPQSGHPLQIFPLACPNADAGDGKGALQTLQFYFPLAKLPLPTARVKSPEPGWEEEYSQHPLPGGY